MRKKKKKTSLILEISTYLGVKRGYNHLKNDGRVSRKVRCLSYARGPVSNTGQACSERTLPASNVYLPGVQISIGKLLGQRGKIGKKKQLLNKYNKKENNNNVHMSQKKEENRLKFETIKLSHFCQG